MSVPVLERQLLTADEVARVLRVSAKTVYRLVHAGRLPAHRIGSDVGPLRIDADELAAWLDENRAPRTGHEPAVEAQAPRDGVAVSSASAAAPSPPTKGAR